jgi:hypothetical protein
LCEKTEKEEEEEEEGDICLSIPTKNLKKEAHPSMD